MVCGPYVQVKVQYAAPENTHTHPIEGQWKFWRGAGLKNQTVKRSVKVNWGVGRRGGGAQTKKPSVGWYGYLTEQHSAFLISDCTVEQF